MRDERSTPRDARGARLRPALCLALAAGLLAAGLLVQGLPPASRPAAAASREDGAAPPRLVVLVVLDLFREDFLTRHEARFGPGGFRRLMRDGARFTSCRYPFALTETAPGHATIVTGTTPDRHGIVSNEWYDAERKRMVEAVWDPDSPLLGDAEAREGSSPWRLVADTLPDALRRATNGRARLFGVAAKARSAVLASGKAADGAYWYDARSGRFVTSRYYATTLPGWVEAFNAARPADRFRGRDGSPGGPATARPTSPGGAPDATYYEALRSTPFLHDLLLEFARSLVENERLGRDATTDLLFLGLSGFDYLGHDTGPDAEAMGALIGRADAQIAEFLQFLDQRLGPTGYWLAVTADHGISPVIGGASKRGLHARSVDGEALLGRIRRELGKRLARGEGIVLQGRPTRVWFDAADLARRGVPAREAAQAAGEAASSFDGILGYVAPSASNLDAATIEAYRLSTYPGRSPDLFLVPQPFVLVTPTTPANHGTPWIYDASVPLLLIGAPFRPGTFRERCSPADLAPTLASALGIPSPAMSTGRVLAEALRGR